MQQWICTKPGQMDLGEVDMPKVKPGFSLLKVRAIGICGTDIHAFAGNQPFFQYPRILGHELALEIVESNSFAVGELVTILPYFNCQTCDACIQGKPNCCENIQVFGVHTDGGMREYINVEDRYILAAQGLTMDELALVEPFAIAAHGLRRGLVGAGEKVLVMGAGPIGLFTLFLAKLRGAAVEVSEPNESRLSFCTETLGIPAAVQSSYAKVIDATGNLAAIESGFLRLAHGGQYILIGLQKQAINFSHPEFHKREATLMSSRNATKEDFEFVMDLFRQRKIHSEWFISHRFDWQTVADEFQSMHDPAQKIIKALITLNK